MSEMNNEAPKFTEPTVPLDEVAAEVTVDQSFRRRLQYPTGPGGQPETPQQVADARILAARAAMHSDDW